MYLALCFLFFCSVPSSAQAPSSLHGATFQSNNLCCSESFTHYTTSHVANISQRRITLLVDAIPLTKMAIHVMARNPIFVLLALLTFASSLIATPLIAPIVNAPSDVHHDRSTSNQPRSVLP